MKLITTFGFHVTVYCIELGKLPTGFIHNGGQLG